jgi:integrase
VKLEKIKAKGAEHLYRHPSTKIIYFRQYKKGKGEVTKSTRTTSLADAKLRIDDLRSLFSSERRKRVNKTALELFDEWIERKKISNKRPATITSIMASRKYLKTFLFDMHPKEINEEFWEKRYIPNVREVTHAKRKFFNDTKWTRSFVRSLKRDGIIERIPLLINPDPKRAAGKVYTDSEVKALLKNSSGDLNLKIQMAITMGMRKGEIQNLEWSRVDLVKKNIILREVDTKTKKARTFGISSIAYRLLKAKNSNAKASPFVFPNHLDPNRPVHPDGFKTAWTNLKKTCEIKGKTFHHLRHTFLTNAFKHPNANAALICTYAGLSLEEAQATYLHFDEDDTRGVSELVSYDI